MLYFIYAIFIYFSLSRESLSEAAVLAGKSLGCGVGRLGWARVQHQDHVVTSHSSDSSFDSGTSSGGGWCQALLALTDSHLLWWETVPATPQMWSLPARSLRLIQTRLVNNRSPIYQTEQYSICIRWDISLQGLHLTLFAQTRGRGGRDV